MRSGESPTVRAARNDDLAALVALENSCFTTDRLSRRSFRHWLQAQHCVFLVAESGEKVIGYCLIILLRGTILARLYSIAIDPAFRGGGLARRLIEEGERRTEEEGKVFLRLEVSVDNSAGINLYQRMGYQPFGIYRNYYEDDNDALRMQKCIRTVPPVARNRPIPWIQQSTAFTCGPAALMMAMSGVSSRYTPTQHEELQIWREATTIFMASGHGGCHPVGLALAVVARGCLAEVWVNNDSPLFVDSVRDDNKKRVIEMVHDDFVAQARDRGVAVSRREFRHDDLIDAFADGAIPLILISTYLMDGKKAPHWVTMSGYDDDCLYVHDPDPDPEEQSASGLDSQFVPIAHDDFVKMSRFGRSQLRTAVIIRNAG